MGARREDIEALYQERYLAFRNGLCAVTGDVEAAREAVQEGFALALRDAPLFRGDGSLAAWIWRICFRAALLGRRGRRAERWEPADDEAAAPFGTEIDAELAAALRALPPRRRLMVFLRHYADCSYAQISELCEVSEGTVAATLAAAHAELREMLEQEGARR